MTYQLEQVIKKNKVSETEMIDAHFFFVDIVGLSNHKLNSAEEQIKKINIMTKSIKSSMVFKTTNDEERLILPTGDGMIIGFKRDMEKPLKLAIELHEKLNSYNKNKENTSKIKIRIGIHSAPVLKFIDIKDQENFWGEGVITSKRIMDLGESDHILLSDKIARDLKQLSKYRKILHPIGETEIKHGFKIGMHSAYGNGFGNKKNPKITK